MTQRVRVVLLHGLGADQRAFGRFVRLLPDEWETHPIDLLGHGTAPKPMTGYELSDHAKYISTILRSLGDSPLGEPVVLVGHSLGAAVAIAVAGNYPQLVRALVLLDPPRAPEVGRALETIQPAGVSQMIRAKLHGQLRPTIHRIFSAQGVPLRDWIEETWEMMAPGVVQVPHPLDWTRYQRNVRCPVTIVHGDQEQGATGWWAVSHFRDPLVFPIEGAGHFLHASHARETAAAVISGVDVMLAR